MNSTSNGSRDIGMNFFSGMRTPNIPEYIGIVNTRVVGEVITSFVATVASTAEDNTALAAATLSYVVGFESPAPNV